MMRVAVVIVNYRTADLVRKCLASLAPEIAAMPGSCARVVDNDSGDGSAEALSRFIADQGYGGWASLVASPSNGGFSTGNNVALRPLLASGEHDAYLLLNPDAFVLPGALAALVARMERDPSIGIVGSRLEDLDGTVQRSAFRFPWAGSELERSISLGPVTRLLHGWAISIPPSDTAHPCDWVAGASMLVRRGAIEKAGLMDEGYFLYFEEVDFCLQVSRAGFSCWHEPLSRVVHLEGQSTGVTSSHNAQRRLPRYWFDSRRRFFLKNYGPARTAAADASFILGRLLGSPGRLARRLLTGKLDEVPAALLADFTRNSVFFRGFRW
jgi:GT2 family glycosyltransferase